MQDPLRDVLEIIRWELLDDRRKGERRQGERRVELGGMAACEGLNRRSYAERRTADRRVPRHERVGALIRCFSDRASAA
jgi:hypothetical protein